MQRNVLITIIFCFCVFIITSCDSNSTKAQEGKYISGKVRNAENENIEGARIVFSYNLEEVPRPTTEVRFMLAEVNKVKIWISRYSESDTLKVLVDDEMCAGSHSVVWDGKSDSGEYVYSYAYDFHFKTDEVERVTNIILDVEYSNVTGNNVGDYEAYTITNSSGEFTIPLDNLLVFEGLDEIIQTDESGNQLGNVWQISHYVKVWALHPDYEATFVDSIFIREDKNVNVNIKFGD